MPEAIANPAKYYIGTSGFHYDHWRDRFYPRELTKSRWLDFYSHHFPTVELNNSFYRLPSVSAFATWREGTPAGFLFAVKVSRLITHLKKLRNVDTALKLFLERASILKEKLGPLLYQLPPNMPRSPANEEAFETFLSLLPRDLQHVFEFRHVSWLEERTFETLRRHNMGFCVMDMPEVSCPIVATADFAYFRFHGSVALYSSCYTEEELKEWANRLQAIGQGLKATYAYFNNDAYTYAVGNAKRLAEILQGAN